METPDQKSREIDMSVMYSDPDNRISPLPIRDWIAAAKRQREHQTPTPHASPNLAANNPSKAQQVPKKDLEETSNIRAKTYPRPAAEKTQKSEDPLFDSHSRVANAIHENPGLNESELRELLGFKSIEPWQKVLKFLIDEKYIQAADALKRTHPDGTSKRGPKGNFWNLTPLGKATYGFK